MQGAIKGGQNGQGSNRQQGDVWEDGGGRGRGHSNAWRKFCWKSAARHRPHTWLASSRVPGSSDTRCHAIAPISFLTCHSMQGVCACVSREEVDGESSRKLFGGLDLHKTEQRQR